MSRYYNMHVHIKGFDISKVEDIKTATRGEWAFDHNEWWLRDDEVLTGEGKSSLNGREDEEEFADRLTRAIFRMNGAPCWVTVTATRLAETSCEYNFDETDYERLVKKAK